MIRLVLVLVVLAAGTAFLARRAERRRRERLAHVRAGFLVSVPAPREHGPVRKEVALRSGAVRMRLPRHWAEEYPDEDHASFRDPGNPGRVLRIACTFVDSAPAGLRALLQARSGQTATTVEDLSGGSLLLRALDAAREDGRDVCVFRWLRAASLPASRASLAAFTLSVPEQTALDPLTTDLVAMLDLEIRAASLA